MAEGAGGKPADFFVGLVDFFAILLPGAMLAFVLDKRVELSDVSFPRLALPEGWTAFAAFALVAYILGHFVFVVGSLCFDPLYDRWKESFRVWNDKGRTKWLAILWDGLKARETLQDQAAEHGFDGLPVAAVYLRLSNPGAAAEMDRLEADQKFFRSLMLVLLIAWVALVWDQASRRWIWAGLALLVAPMLPFKIFQDVWPRTTGPAADTTAAVKDRLKRLAELQLPCLVLLMAGWISWFVLTPPWSTSRRATEATRVERQAVSVSVKTGELSFTANAPNQEPADPVLAMITAHPRASRAFLLLGLALSLLRFVQQRLKYSKFVYRAVIVLAKYPALTGAGGGG